MPVVQFFGVVFLCRTHSNHWFPLGIMPAGQFYSSSRWFFPLLNLLEPLLVTRDHVRRPVLLEFMVVSFS